MAEEGSNVSIEDSEEGTTATASVKYKKRSFVHDYFHNNLCNICKLKIKTPSGNTTNLRQHLCSKHKSTFDELLSKEADEKKKKSVTNELSHILIYLVFR